MNILDRLQHDIKAPFKLIITNLTEDIRGRNVSIKVRIVDPENYFKWKESILCSECGHIKDPEPEKKFSIQHALRLLREYESAVELDKVSVNEVNKKYEALKDYIKRG